MDVEVSLRPTLLEVVDESLLARIDAWRDASKPQPKIDDTNSDRSVVDNGSEAVADVADSQQG